MSWKITKTILYYCNNKKTSKYKRYWRRQKFCDQIIIVIFCWVQLYWREKMLFEFIGLWRAREGRRPWATTISPSVPHISFFVFWQPWATTISPSVSPHLTLPGKTTFLNGILRAFKVWFSKIQINNLVFIKVKCCCLILKLCF